MNQPDTEVHYDRITPEKIQLIFSKIRKVPAEQVARSEFSIPTQFVFYIITEREKTAFITDAISFTENLIYDPTKSLPSEKHCSYTYSIALISD